MNKATIIDYDLDENKNIRVWTQYIINDIEIQSNYPKKNDKYVFCSRYDTLNFQGLSDEKIVEKIQKDVDVHLNNLICREYIIKSNQDILTNKLPSLELKGLVVEKEKGTINISDTVSLDVTVSGTIVIKDII